MFYLYKYEQHSFLSNQVYFAFVSLLTLLMAILFHELGHYIAAIYYGLEPTFGISFSAIYVKTDFSNLTVHEIVSHAGPMVNLIIAFFTLIFLYIRGHTLHMDDYVCLILFLVPVTNILVALFSLIIFMFTGAL